jgi:alkylated DNA repair dioxygenase AlkB
MSTLFAVDNIFPEGFSYIADFIDTQEENELLLAVQQVEVHNMRFQGYEAKRKTASFGYDYSFEKRSLSKGKEIPEAFHFLVHKVATHLSLQSEDIAELLVTEYPVGSVINWHRDAPPFDIIAGISLQADCIFRLRPHDKSKQGRRSIISIPVKRRSLYLMRGKARSDWQHSISPVKETRYSITLRTLRSRSFG